MKQFKKEKCPKGYKEATVKLKSGFICTFYINPNHSDYYEKIYGHKLTHVEFYGETISETGYRSWFGSLERFMNKSEGAENLAQILEDETLQKHPNLLAEIEQQSLF